LFGDIYFVRRKDIEKCQVCTQEAQRFAEKMLATVPPIHYKKIKGKTAEREILTIDETAQVTNLNLW
jgi:uncharacterized protein YqfB (UPF0267 family)